MAALERAVGPQRTEMIISGKVPVVATCGSGMTAGVIWLGLKILGVNNCSLYDEVSISRTRHRLSSDDFIVVGGLCIAQSK